MGSWAVTYGFCVMNHDNIYPDDIRHGGVSILQHSQARRDTKDFGRSYSNEEGEYCAATI